MLCSRLSTEINYVVRICPAGSQRVTDWAVAPEPNARCQAQSSSYRTRRAMCAGMSRMASSIRLSRLFDCDGSHPNDHGRGRVQLPAHCRRNDSMTQDRLRFARILRVARTIKRTVSVRETAERPEPGHYRKASAEPWARKPEITCFLALGSADAFL